MKAWDHEREEVAQTTTVSLLLLLLLLLLWQFSGNQPSKERNKCDSRNKQRERWHQREISLLAFDWVQLTRRGEIIEGQQGRPSAVERKDRPTCTATSKKCSTE